MVNVLVVGSVLASLAASPVPAGPAADPVSAPPSQRVTIEVATVNGSGCPAGTAKVETSADNSSFAVSYSDYLAADGAGAAPTDIRKNCQLNLRVNVPAGFTFAIARADYAGFASLAAGAVGEQLASYYFTGNSETAQVGHDFTGPLSGDWRTTDTAAAAIWAPCGLQRNLNINTELRVEARTAESAKSTSFLTMDSTRGAVRTIYHLNWRGC
jgi:hypothetical protein